MFRKISYRVVGFALLFGSVCVVVSESFIEEKPRTQKMKREARSTTNEDIAGVAATCIDRAADIVSDLAGMQKQCLDCDMKILNDTYAKKISKNELQDRRDEWHAIERELTVMRSKIKQMSRQVTKLCV